MNAFCMIAASVIDACLYFNKNLPLYADTASVIGLIITVWVALSVYTLRQKATFKGRSPDFASDMRTCSTELTSLLSSRQFDQMKSEVCVRRFFSSLKSLRRTAPKELQPSIKTLSCLIKKQIGRKGRLDKKSTREIYNNLMTLESDFLNYTKDEHWRISQ